MLGNAGSSLTFGTPALAEVFSDAGFADAFLQIERALLQAQQQLELVPAGESDRLAALSVADLDLDAAAADALRTGNPVSGLIEQIHRIAPYAHFGITSHDAWDVAHVLQLRAAMRLVLDDVALAVERLAALSERWADTPILGRTQGQSGAPTTLGFKLATLLDELLRAAQRLQQATHEACVVTVAGAVGTASSFAVIGADPQQVEARVADLLGLATTRTPWFTSRDRSVALASAIAQLSTVAGRTGHEVYSLQRTGIGELADGRAAGSSSVPQKSNPWLAQKMRGLAVVARSLSATVAESAALAEGERELGSMYGEWYGLSQLCQVGGRLAADLAALVGALHVDEARIRANLDADPAVLSESAAMMLSHALGKHDGHALAKEAMRRHRGGESYESSMAWAFERAGLEVPADLKSLPGSHGWAATRAREVAAAARGWKPQV